MRAFGHGGDELVTPPRQSFDKARGFRIVPEHCPNIPDVALEHFWLDVGFGPQGLQQLVLCHQTPGMLYQVTEHGKGLGSQQETLLASSLTAPQTLVDQV